MIQCSINVNNLEVAPIMNINCSTEKMTQTELFNAKNNNYFS